MCLENTVLSLPRDSIHSIHPNFILMTKKKLPVRYTGQHFTIDKTLISDSIKFANLKPTDTVLDIGAGKGFLTIHLITKSKCVIAVEKDSDLALYLKQKFRHNTNLTIVNCDFLKFHLPNRQFKVVSNIPYSITSEILNILMYDNLERFSGGTLVVQLEAAKKLVSNSIFNPYVVFYKTFYNLKLKYEINPNSFMPPPTVNSALLCIETKPIQSIEVNKVKYLRFIQKILYYPDKKLRTVLKSIFRKSQIRVICQKHSIDPDISVITVKPFILKICYDEMLKVVPEKHHP